MQIIMKLDRILELIARQMGQVASEDELKELESLLQQYPQHRHLVSILQSIQAKKLKQPTQNEDLVVAQGWEKLQQKMNSLHAEGAPPTAGRPLVRNLLRPATLRWAAMCAGLLVLAAVLYFRNYSPDAPLSMASAHEAVPHGRPEVTTLPDGSVVWINAGSKISFRTENNTRAVYLDGEAYFQVKHDAEHPFVVHAGTIEVRALGTEFNVTAYPGEDRVETTLISGKVQVTMAEKPDQSIILDPHEKLTVNSRRVRTKDTSVQTEVSFEVKPVHLLPAEMKAPEIIWMQDKLAFQNESFDNLARRMERRYNVHIVIVDEDLKKERLSGIFENEHIQKALKVLQMTTPFHYQIKSDSVFVSRR